MLFLYYYLYHDLFKHQAASSSKSILLGPNVYQRGRGVMTVLNIAVLSRCLFSLSCAASRLIARTHFCLLKGTFCVSAAYIALVLGSLPCW